jgi:CSLREA domain-containing protein
MRSLLPINIYRLLFVISGLFLTACDKNIEQYVSEALGKKPITNQELPAPPVIPVNPPIALSYSTSILKIYAGESLSAIAPSVSGSVDSFSISPDLPPGMQFDHSSGIISGSSANAISQQSYTITATNTAGSISAQLQIVVGKKFTVNSTADLSDSSIGNGICEAVSMICTLRAAIDEANSISLPSKIVLLSGTYPMTNGQLVITSDVMIEGASQSGTILDGLNTARIISASGPALTLRNLTLQNGNGNNTLGVKGYGAAVNYVFAGGEFTLDQITADNNRAIFTGQAYNGGAIRFDGYPGGTAVITDSIFSNNESRLNGAGSSSGGGGGLYISGESAIIRRTKFNNNVGHGFGGGLYVNAETTLISDSEFIDNEVRSMSGGGGAIQYQGGGPNSVVERNLFKGNKGAYGGGIKIEWTEGGRFINNTFYGNAGEPQFGSGGGAVYMFGGPTDDSIEFINNTFANNTRGFAAASAVHCFACSASVPIYFSNNVFLQNTAPTCQGMMGPGLTSRGGNIDDGSSCGLNLTTDLVNTDALLTAGPPVYNSGPTGTMSLQIGSPAIDFAVPNLCPAVDQRNVVRNSSTCASGAFQN